MGEPTKPAPEPDVQRKDVQELKEEQLESVAGGVIDGGCLPPYLPPWEVPDPMPD